MNKIIRRAGIWSIGICLLTACSGPIAIAAEPAKTDRYVITDSGAMGDGKTLNTQSIQQTIDRCAAAGGGTLVVPSGTFLTGAIFLKQGVNLTIEKDGVLKGSPEQKDYPQVPTRWEGIERQWTSALVNAIDMKHLRIDGQGAIDGSGDLWLQRGGRPAATAPSGTPPAAAPAARGLGRPRLMCIQNCTDVHISNLNLHNQAVWCLHILYSQDVVAEKLLIQAAHNIPSSDGIDIDSSRRVLITGCDIDVNDDCISIKSGKDADGLRVNRPSEDIIVEKTRLAYGHGGVAMGSETSGGIRNVEVRNCVSEAGNWAPIRFKTQPSRSGVVENITYRDIQLKDTKQAFEFNMEWRMVGAVQPPAAVLPIVRNIKIINVTGTVTSVGTIHGLKDSPIQNVSFENVKLTAQRGLTVENLTGEDFSGLSLEVQQGEKIIRRGGPATKPASISLIPPSPSEGRSLAGTRLGH